jgi:hypothetical protein
MLYRRHRASTGVNDKLDFGFFRQLVAAAKRSRRLDYEHDLQKWQDMKEQLRRILDESITASAPRGMPVNKQAILDEVTARLEFSEQRLKIMARPRPFRLAQALGVFWAGQYDEFASGWKSFLKDLLIA